MALAGFDTVVVAQTGSGKTLGYLLPIFDAILVGSPSPQRRAQPLPVPRRCQACELFPLAAAI